MSKDFVFMEFGELGVSSGVAYATYYNARRSRRLLAPLLSLATDARSLSRAFPKRRPNGVSSPDIILEKEPE